MRNCFALLLRRSVEQTWIIFRTDYYQEKMPKNFKNISHWLTNIFGKKSYRQFLEVPHFEGKERFVQSFIPISLFIFDLSFEKWMQLMEFKIVLHEKSEYLVVLRLYKISKCQGNFTHFLVPRPLIHLIMIAISLKFH